MQRETTKHQHDGMSTDKNPISSDRSLDNFPSVPNVPIMRLASSNNRDSGYGTDINSPASQTSGTSTSSAQRFTFGSLPEEFGNMDLNEDHGDVFIDSTEQAHPNDDGDDTDKEVEDLLSDSVDANHSVSQPINIQRPQAPIPTPEEIDIDLDEDTTVKFTIGEEYTYSDISRPYHHTQWTRQDRQRNRFRPIASRSFGTQTPSPDGIGSLPSRRPLRPTSARGRGLSRLRLRSESEMPEGPSPLPDVIPFPRDRSVSLPEVPSYSRVQEREVGRELRRISDEFLSSFSPIQQRNGHSSSFPMRMNIDVQSALNRLRRIVSSSSMTPEVDDQPFKFPPNK